MNAWLKSTLGISAAGLLVLLAANGKALVDVLLAAWLFLLKLAATAPLGVSSFALALALAVLVQPFVRRWIAPLVACTASRDFLVESAALAVGFAVMWGQLRSINGALLGILAGLLAPYVHKGAAALLALAWRAGHGSDA